MGFEPLAFRHRPDDVSFIYGIFLPITIGMSKATSELRTGIRYEDLHLFPICIETLPLDWSDVFRFYGILTISIF
jgi:hypothetical protein